MARERPLLCWAPRCECLASTQLQKDGQPLKLSNAPSVLSRPDLSAASLQQHQKAGLHVPGSILPTRASKSQKASSSFLVTRIRYPAMKFIP